MQTTANFLVAWIFLAALVNGFGATRYVNVNSASPTPPYTNWATAATIIQQAVDVAVAGDEIVVTNGVYQTGGRAVYGTMTNRVAVDKPLTVRSANGPEVTVIQGYQVPGTTNGDGAVRCVYLTNGVTLVGFTLTNGAADVGGGVLCKSASSVVSNCVLTGNSASSDGGGALGGTLNNCRFTGNSADSAGGGAAYSALINCTLVGNSGAYGGGAYGGYGEGTLNNCTLIGNSAGYGGGAYGCTLNNCTLTGNSAEFGGGATGVALGSPCILNNCTLSGNSALYDGGGAGGGGDFRGPGCGLNNCILYYNTAPNGANYGSGAGVNYCCTTPLPLFGVGNSTNGPAFVDLANGNLRLRPDSPCIDAGTNLSAIITNDLDGRPRPLDGDGNGIAAFDMGAYEYRALHVWQESPSPAPPYGTWATAATNIQDAVDAAVAGDEIVVTNGVYQTGGRAVDGTVNNRVAVDKPLTLRSVNGPGVTVIAGGGAVRCAYLSEGAALVGFTLTNGAAQYGDYGDGGGIWCASASAVVSNCVLSGNSAGAGGGASGGTLNNCTLTGNVSRNWYGGGGGALHSTLNHCTLTSNWAVGRSGPGGGAAECTLNNCVLANNSAGFGGGAYGGTLNNCTLTGNSAYAGGGGGANGGTLNNCTLTGNSAYSGGGTYEGALNNCTVSGNSAGESGGGAYDSTLNNCIVYLNTAPNGANYDQDQFGGILDFCCTTPLPTNGVGNFTNAPLFVDQAGGNLRLQSNSPCINAGLNAYAPAGFDLDGNPRIVGDTVDVGAYEFQSPQSAISYAWLQSYGLPTNGSVDFTDADGDGLNNWQEWRCLTDPTNALSVLRLWSPASGPSGVMVRWQSVSGRTYFLDRGTNLGAQPPFLPLATDIVGQDGTTTFPDTNAVGAGPFFYRVGVLP